MRKIPTEEAVGQVLCHDITRIIPDKEKGIGFKKGHIIREKDVPELKKLGKDHIYVWEVGVEWLHEDAAAEILRRICQGAHMLASEPREGKIELTAEANGLFKVDTARLLALNSLGEMMIATRHGNFPVQAGDKLAGMRVIPLVIEAAKMHAAEQLAGNTPLLTILPLHTKKAAIIATGNEIYHRRIEDKFTPVVINKLAEYNCEVIFTAIAADICEQTTALIRQALDMGAELIICTGGMSVDPDDLTPAAIRASGAQVITYGSPVLPGAMIMLAYFYRDGQTVVAGQESGMSAIPIVGLPGCAMYNKRTVFDLLLPRLLADDKINAQEIARLGEGGLCLDCQPCIFPCCGFGK